MTCGSDCDVRMFVGLEDDDVSEFSVSSSRLTGLHGLLHSTCQVGGGGGRADIVAMAMDNNTVQAFTTNVSQ